MTKLAELSPAIVLVHGLGLKKSHEDELGKWLTALTASVANDAIDLATVDITLAYYSDELHPEVRRVQGTTTRGSVASQDEIREGLRVTQAETDENALLAALLDLQTEELRAETLLGMQPEVDDLQTRGGAYQLSKVDVRLDEHYSAFFCDVVKYFGLGYREPVNAKLTSELQAAKDRPLLLLSHSLGTIVAYDVIMTGEPIHVDMWITLGSPLGYVHQLTSRLPAWLDQLSEERLARIAEIGRKTEDFVTRMARLRDDVQSAIATFTDDITTRGIYIVPDPEFPDASVERWFNLYDPYDPVAAPSFFGSPRLAPVYLSNARQKVYDVPITNPAPHPHSEVGYLGLLQTGGLVRDFLARHR